MAVVGSRQSVNGSDHVHCRRPDVSVSAWASFVVLSIRDKLLIDASRPCRNSTNFPTGDLRTDCTGPDYKFSLTFADN